MHIQSLYIKYTSSCTSFRSCSVRSPTFLPFVLTAFQTSKKSCYCGCVCYNDLLGAAMVNISEKPHRRWCNQNGFYSQSDAILAPLLAFNWYCNAVIQIRLGICVWAMLLKGNLRREIAQPCRQEYKSTPSSKFKIQPRYCVFSYKFFHQRGQKYPSFYQLAGLTTLLQGGGRATYSKSIAVLYWDAAGLRVDR